MTFVVYKIMYYFVFVLFCCCCCCSLIFFSILILHRVAIASVCVLFCSLFGSVSIMWFGSIISDEKLI